MKNKSFVYVYYSETENKFKVFTSSQPLDAVKESHPDMQITYCFPETANIVNSMEDFAEEFYKTYYLYGLKIENINEQFAYKGSLYTLLGISKKNRKYKIIARNKKSGSIMKFTGGCVKHMIFLPPKNTQTLTVHTT